LSINIQYEKCIGSGIYSRSFIWMQKESKETSISKEATLELTKHNLNTGNYVVALASFTVNGKNITPGEVRINDTTLNKQPDYNFLLDNLNVSGTYWTGYVEGNNTWKFSGGPEEGIPAFTEAAPTGFSSINLTNSDSSITIDRSAPFTINWNNAVACDSIEVYIHDRVTGSDLSSGFFQGTASSYTFTVNQLSALNPFDISTGGTSNYSFIEVRGINYRKVNEEGLNIALRNISTFSQFVNIK
jgi:hypothetical protein